MNTGSYLLKITTDVAELTERFASRITVNHNLDRKLVSFQANKSVGGYRWCKYKEGFSAALMQYVFRQLNLSADSLVLEPFAGAGTALFVASECGVNTVGIELLPSSAEIIETRQLIGRHDQAALAKELRRVAKSCVWKTRGPRKHFSVLAITDGAYPSKTACEIERYLYEVEHAGTDLGRILRFALLCVLEQVSFTRKDGQYLRWDQRSGRRQGARPFDKGKIYGFTEAITQKLADMAGDIAGDGTLFEDEPQQQGRFD